MLMQARFIPEGAIERRYDDLKVVVYLYTQNGGRFDGKPCAIGYVGPKHKAEYHHGFPNEERRDAHISQWLEGLRGKAQQKAKARAEKLAFRHDLKVGDVLMTTWGWEQTNADFYQVVRVPSGKTVVIRHIKEAITKDAGDGAMSGYAMPVLNEFDSGEMLVRYGEHGARISQSRGYARKWNGNKVRVTWYA